MRAAKFPHPPFQLRHPPRQFFISPTKVRILGLLPLAFDILAPWCPIPVFYKTSQSDASRIFTEWTATSFGEDEDSAKASAH